jgi:hypothetical protein
MSLDGQLQVLVLTCSPELPPSMFWSCIVLRYMLDFEEFRFLEANACVIVTIAKSIATVAITTIAIIFPCCIEVLLLYFIIILLDTLFDDIRVVELNGIY